MFNARNLQLMILLPLTCLAFAAGCKSEPDKPVYREMDGRVIDVDQAKDLFKFEFFKDGKRKVVEGALAPDAEILINGRTASIKDVQINEDIHVRALIKREGGEYRFIAKKVTVERPEEPVGDADGPGDGPETAPSGADGEPAAESN